MRLIHWFTRNQANTRGPTHPDLAPLLLPGPPAAAARRVEDAVRSLSGWRVELADAASGTIHLIRRTRVWRFVDDIRLTVTPTADGVRVDAASRSRFGVGDLGQNRRNILELWRAIQANPER